MVTQQQPTIYLEVDPVKVGGSWMGDSATHVNLAVIGSTASSFTDDTTTTTAPAPSTTAP